MQWRAFSGVFPAAGIFFAAFGLSAQPAPQMVRLSDPQLWQRLEFLVTNVPAATNPFDPDVIRVDAAFTLPSGPVLTVPGFWYQGYQRGISGGYEYLNAVGAPQWRVRFTPPETGSYSVALTIRTNGRVYGSTVVTNFTVPTGIAAAGSGYARVAASRQYFETGDGQALRLVGENVGWPGGRGTYDYDDWFGAMNAAGENYARLWMCPWAFGIETDSNSLTQYRLDRAWQLDYVLQLAEQRGIYVLLCLEYHGMFGVVPDMWGGDNLWPVNPYNVADGGPCINQDAFFTNSVAWTIYQKRLRYLVARYGYSPSLFAWQFFNEIDNEYAYLVPGDVAAWHEVMGAWMHTNDPFHHLVTTSLTGSSDRPEIWTVPDLDYACYHSYGEPGPASRLDSVAQSFLQRYGKPVIIDEFGMDASGWNRTNDPYLRGFRQGLWGGALGGSAGTGMSWWWENIQSENLYPLYVGLGNVLKRTGWGRGTWTNISFVSNGLPPPTVGDAVPGGQPFAAFLTMSPVWGALSAGRLAIPDSGAAGYSALMLDSFVHGIWHSDLKTPFQLNAWFTNNARLVMHLNSVSDGSILVVQSDGIELFRTNIPNLDGTYSVDNEYNIDLPVPLPSGKHTITITNAGTDWFFLDWVRLEQVLPSTYAGNWTPSPEAIGQRGPHESLLYVVAPGVSFPGNATNSNLDLQHGKSVVLTNWPPGAVYAQWYDPSSGTFEAMTHATGSNSVVSLPLPDFSEDLAGVVYSPPSLTPVSLGKPGGFKFRFDSETGGKYVIERSTDLASWTPFESVTNDIGTLLLVDPSAPSSSRLFFRARSE